MDKIFSADKTAENLSWCGKFSPPKFSPIRYPQKYDPIRYPQKYDFPKLADQKIVIKLARTAKSVLTEPCHSLRFPLVVLLYRVATTDCLAGKAGNEYQGIRVAGI